MKITGYAINLGAEYESNFISNDRQRVQKGKESLARVSGNMDEVSIDASAKHGYTLDQVTSANLSLSAAMKKTDFNMLSQKTSVDTSGTINAEGGTFSFSMNSSLQSTHINVRSSKSTDPIVIGLNGELPEFTSKQMSFDIDADGKMDQISTLKQGSGYLAIDKNNNGVIDDGSELIGTKSGGFNELAYYDEDNNGFIDENDSVYEKLKVWSKTGERDSLKSLKDANVGALYTDSVKNDYEYIMHGETAAFLTASSFAISEDGRAMSLSQVEVVSHAQDEPLQANANTQTATGQSQVDEGDSSGKWVKTENGETQDVVKDETLSSTIESQIGRLEKQQKDLTNKARYAQNPEEERDFTRRASMVGGQISVLKASLFKLEEVKFDEKA